MSNQYRFSVTRKQKAPVTITECGAANYTTWDPQLVNDTLNIKETYAISYEDTFKTNEHMSLYNISEEIILTLFIVEFGVNIKYTEESQIFFKGNGKYGVDLVFHAGEPLRFIDPEADSAVCKFVIPYIKSEEERKRLLFLCGKYNFERAFKKLND